MHLLCDTLKQFWKSTVDSRLVLKVKIHSTPEKGKLVKLGSFEKD